jgi:hypothetical protein
VSASGDVLTNSGREGVDASQTNRKERRNRREMGATDKERGRYRPRGNEEKKRHTQMQRKKKNGERKMKKESANKKNPACAGKKNETHFFLFNSILGTVQK